MGACLILTPVVVAAWPAFASAVASAAASLGYATGASALEHDEQADEKMMAGVELNVPNSEVVTDQLGRDEKIIVTRDGVSITFRRDTRGKPSLTVTGNGLSHDQLRALGEEMSQRVVRDYVYQQIMDEVRSRGFMVVEESVDGSNAIHISVRHWEN
jgi:hypothetical protein